MKLTPTIRAGLHRGLLLGAVLMSSTAWSQSTKPILFVLFDAGETHALIPVLEELRADQVPFQILAFSTAASLLQNCPECIPLKIACQISPSFKSGTSKAPSPLSHEDSLLNAEELTRLTQCLDPGLVVTGAPSMTQFQIALQFKAKGTRLIAYFDAFSTVLEGSIGSRFLKIADEFWVPSESVRAKAELLPHSGIVKVAGQPTLDTWSKASQSESREAIRSQLPGFDPSKKTLLFAGGYGKGYAESLTVFFEALSEPTKEDANGLVDVQILISPHPRMGDALEREKLRAFPNLHPIIVPASVGTMKATFVSDLLVSQNSTAGLLTLFAGGKSLYLDPLQTDFSNFAIEQGLAGRVATKSEFLSAAHRLLQAARISPNSERSVHDVYDAAQTPENSSRLMKKWLKQEQLHQGAETSCSKLLRSPE